MTIDGPEQFAARLEHRLSDAGLPDAVVQAAGSGLRDLLIPEDVSGSLQARLRLPQQEHGYLFGDDELNLLERSFVLSTGAAGAGYGLFANAALTDASVAMGIAQVAFGLYRILHKLRRKAVRVTSAQYEVVGALKAIDAPATTEQVRAVLGERADGVDVEESLDELSRLRLPDGKRAGFVERDESDRWRVSGI